MPYIRVPEHPEFRPVREMMERLKTQAQALTNYPLRVEYYPRQYDTSYDQTGPWYFLVEIRVPVWLKWIPWVHLIKPLRNVWLEVHAIRDFDDQLMYEGWHFVAGQTPEDPDYQQRELFSRMALSELAFFAGGRDKLRNSDLNPADIRRWQATRPDLFPNLAKEASQ